MTTSTSYSAPQSADANYLMGSVSYEWHDYDKAQAFAEKAVQLAPRTAEYHWLLAQIVGDQAEQASIFRQIGLAKRFRSETETVLRLDPAFQQGSADRALGRWYFKVPGLFGGSDRK